MKINIGALIAAGILTTITTAGVATAGIAPERGGHFAKIDTNKDGQISQAEWNQASAARFQKLDANKDGKLTTEEMPQRGGRGHGHGPRGMRGAPPAPAAPSTTAPAPAPAK